MDSLHYFDLFKTGKKSMVSPLGGPSGRRISVHQVGVDETQAQKLVRRRSRFHSRRFTHDQDTIVSAQTPPPPPSPMPWSALPAHIGTKIKNAFTIAVDWIQKLVMGAGRFVLEAGKAVLAFFLSPFKNNPEDDRAAAQRSVSQGRATPENLRVMLGKMKPNPINEEDKQWVQTLLITMLERLGRSKKPADYEILQTIYSEVGKILLQQAQPPPETSQETEPLPEQEKESWGAWVGRGVRAVGRGIQSVGGGVNKALSRLVDYTPTERGEVYLRPDGSNFEGEKVLEYAELIRGILLGEKKK